MAPYSWRLLMEKPRLSFWQIWNMSFGFLGIQFGWGLQMANMSAIYQYLGARENEIPILWLAAPLTGLIVQPIIGYYSDRTWNRLGRRRPYFLGGAIAASLALLRHAELERLLDGRGPPAGSSTPPSTSAWSRSAPSSATCCRTTSARAASRCRAC